jgi:deoxyribonuclease-4
MIRFGPAGNDSAFTEAGWKATVDAPAWIAAMGLTAYEYQCGRGVRVGQETAQKIGAAARENGIQLSLHAPYFINLSSRMTERIEGNRKYVLDSCAAARAMGADRIVVHTGGLGKLSRGKAMENTRENVRELLEEKDSAGYADIRICLETMGKINVIGTAEEIFELVAMDDRLLPCIDFGHLNARTHGGLMTAEAVTALFDAMENTIGRERSRIFHSHFSKIEYGKGGEVRHLTFADTVYGPHFEAVARETAARGFEPRFICESAGTQARDAAEMQRIYQSVQREVVLHR